MAMVLQTVEASKPSGIESKITAGPLAFGIVAAPPLPVFRVTGRPVGAVRLGKSRPLEVSRLSQLVYFRLSLLIGAGQFPLTQRRGSQ